MWRSTAMLSVGAATVILATGGLAREAVGQQPIGSSAISPDQGTAGLGFPAPVSLLTHDELAGVVQQAQPPVALTPAEIRATHWVSERLRAADYAGGLEQWSYVVQRVTDRVHDVDLYALAAWVLRETYLTESRALRDQADRVRSFNERKKSAREYASELRERRAQLARGGDPTRTVPVRRLTFSDSADDPSSVRTLPIEMTVESLTEELQRIVVLADAAEEGERMASVELQGWLQKQQQTLQIMSNVSKLLNDTAATVINRVD